MKIEELHINEKKLIENSEYFYEKSSRVLNDFGGPSVYFHIQAIAEQQKDFLSLRHLEMIYATLASWGMHRMGDPEKSRTKLHSFESFSISINKYKKELFSYKDLSFLNLDFNEYVSIIKNLEPIYNNLKISISDSTIVANSKALAHVLLNLIPPIDRQYTIRFFRQDDSKYFYENGKYKIVNIKKDCKKQFEDFIEYCSRIKNIFDRVDHTNMKINKQAFNTSYPKIIDNMIMTYVKDVPKPIKTHT